MKVFPFIVASALAFSATWLPAAQYSQLWGERGEKWTSQSRLPDFSFAGYHCGEKPLPKIAPGVSVKAFGAQGDGVADDTQAFLDALAHVQSGAIEVPPGRYKITGLLEITRPNIVLRGAGPDQTVLFFPTPLNDIKPNWGATTTGERTSNYSWSGGFLTIRGSFQSKTLATVVEAKRGDTRLRVSSTKQLRVDQRVEVFQSDTPDNSLAIHLYSGDAGPVANLKGRATTSLVCRITRVEGDRVYFDRPLRCDLKPAWRPQIRGFEPTVTESGVENLCFEFPDTPYQGHFTELGYNAVTFDGVADCWLRNVRTVNADSGLFVSGNFNTVQGIVLESARHADQRLNCVGHHGISLGGGDNLVADFDFRVRYIHDITVSHHCSGNVCARGRGVDLALDHHRYAPYENLFTDLDAGAGTRLWRCGGGAALGKHCGARGTFWNIRSARPLSYPPADFGPPSMNLIALETTQDSEPSADREWFEAIKPADIRPQDLHEAQLQRRLQRRTQRDVATKEWKPH